MPSQMVWEVTMVLPTKAVTRHMGIMQLMMTPAHPTRQRMLANICIPMEAMTLNQNSPNSPQQAYYGLASPAALLLPPLLNFSAQFFSFLCQISPVSLHVRLRFCYFLLAMPASCFRCRCDSRCVSARPRLICLQPALPHFSPPPSVFAVQRRSVYSR